MQKSNQQFLHNVFEQAVPRLTRLAGRLTDNPESAVEAARTIFEEMVPDMAYVDSPQQPLAGALFTCTVNLSLYLSLKENGVGVHEFGNAMLTGLSRAPVPPPPTPDEAYLAGFKSVADASRNAAKPGEDVFEYVAGEEGAHDWGYNVTSCAICHQYAKYDAMDLVPYMCATDDLMSDKGGHGLRRTGSIALGASHCDFRYKTGGEPRPLADQYPELIRWVRDDPQIS